MRAIPLKAVTNRFPQVGGNQTSEAPLVVFNPIQGDEDMETPPPNDSFKASLSPPVGGLAHKQMFIKRVTHYHQWLRSSIHLKTKFSQSPSDSVRLQGPSKRTSSDLLYPFSSVKECNRKGGKCKISRVLQSPVSCTQASPKVEANNRSKQEKSELKPTQVFSFLGYKYHLDSALVKPTQERWLKLQDLIL